MFTMKRCSLIRGVHYERFHCRYKNVNHNNTSGNKSILNLGKERSDIN